MFVTSWKLTILTFVLIPILVLVSQIYGGYIRQLSEDTQGAVANSTKVAEEVVSSMSTVRSFANEPIECKRWVFVFCADKPMSVVAGVILPWIARRYREELKDFYDLNLKQV
jgi:ABC-type multidrug transport system fused ATPase/permease subunit